MDSEIHDAWRRAGLKLAIGSLLIAAAVGARIVLVTPTDPADPSPGASPAERGSLGDTRELVERVDTSAGETREDTRGSSETPREQEGLLTGRLGALGDSFKERLEGSAATAEDGDRIVSCRLQGVLQYMRADDCELRGGSVFEGER